MKGQLVMLLCAIRDRLAETEISIYQVPLDLDCNVCQYKEHMVCNAAGRTLSEAHRVAERP